MVGTNKADRGGTTRSLLLAAAREVFAEKGYGGATVTAITNRAETAHGTFYLYFKNREAVFVDLITDLLEELYRESFTPLDALSGPYDPARSRDRIASFLAVIARHGRLWRAVLEGALASSVVEAHWMSERRRFVVALAARWEVFQVDGTARTFDTEVTAAAMASMLEWFAFSTVAFGPQVSPAEGQAAGDTLLDARVIDALADLWGRVVGSTR
ncbi:MAG: transcriptional regulator, TetR family [Acidimicrobiales bacterium]|nr:transcriptional regulator, TetR family [Acidimicrobiales bacterium]